MSKAKANTAQANVLVQSKQAEAEAARKAEAEKARRLELQEAERKKREVEARLRREHEQRLLQQRLQEEKEKKRLEKSVTVRRMLALHSSRWTADFVVFKCRPAMTAKTGLPKVLLARSMDTSECLSTWRQLVLPETPQRGCRQ